MKSDGKTARRGAVVAGVLGLCLATQATAQQAYVGEIRSFGNSFCPQNWAAADGQLLAIAQNDALFSLLGTIYGGDGRTTFGLPDLRGRTNIFWGSGPGLNPVRLGEKGGSEVVTLTTPTMPSHSHAMMANDTAGTAASPQGTLLAQPTLNGSPGNLYATDAARVPMAPGSIAPTGGSQPHQNMAPYQAINWCIALYGIYPSRS